MTLFVAGRLTPTNVGLIDACRALDLAAALLPLERVRRRARAGDVVLPRLDVVSTLDGVEPGLEMLAELERRGALVVNPAGAILAAHDKLATALKLGTRGVPHPLTIHVDRPPERLPLEPPVVVKPRFGSWGRDVVLCRSERDLNRTLRHLTGRQWFRRQGALVQELVRPQGHDLRVLVAAGEPIGAVKRVSAAGEWRTNVALGGTRVPTVAPADAEELAVEAAAALGAGFVGIDLLPCDDGYVVLEVNGCVDFTSDYGVGSDVFGSVVAALERLGRERARELARASRPAQREPVGLPDALR